MSDLSSRAQALVNVARASDAPLGRDKARIKRRVLAQVAAASLASAGATASPGAAAASNASAASTGAAGSASTLAGGNAAAPVAAAGSGGTAAAAAAGALGAKVALAGIAGSVLIAGSVAGGWIATRTGPDLRHALRATPGAIVSPSDEKRPAVTAPLSATPGASTSATPRATDDVVANRELLAHEAGILNGKPRRHSPATLEQELPLLQGAQEALREGDVPRALGLLDAHARRFPDGVLAPERRAVHAMAACRGGSWTAGRAEAEAFVRDAPRSPLAPRVRAACLLAPEPPHDRGPE
jgi:hypothetical protein